MITSAVQGKHEEVNEGFQSLLWHHGATQCAVCRLSVIITLIHYLCGLELVIVDCEVPGI